MPRPKKQHLKQRKDGRFKCSFHGKQFYGDTEAEALAARDEYKRLESAGEYKRENPTVDDYAERWLPLHKSGVSSKCYNDYKKQLDAMVSVIGELPISDVTVDDAASVWKRYEGYSASTIKRAKMLFTALFDTAIENELIHRNPFRGRYAQPPKAPSGTHRALSEDEQRLIRETPHRMQLGALIMLYAGLRRGEALALTKKDIDLKAGTISVSKAVRFDGNRPVITAPKTAAGTRTVPILSVLRPYLENRSDRVLSAANGEIMSETAFTRCWQSYLLHLSKAAGHPVDIRPHDLRHTYCTILRDSGVDMHQAIVWLGHADEKMILRVYDHIGSQRTQSSIDLVEKNLSKVQNEVQSNS